MGFISSQVLENLDLIWRSIANFWLWSMMKRPTTTIRNLFYSATTPRQWQFIPATIAQSLNYIAAIITWRNCTIIQLFWPHTSTVTTAVPQELHPWQQPHTWATQAFQIFIFFDCWHWQQYQQCLQQWCGTGQPNTSKLIIIIWLPALMATTAVPQELHQWHQPHTWATQAFQVIIILTAGIGSNTSGASSIDTEWGNPILPN